MELDTLFEAFQTPESVRAPIRTWLDLLRQWNKRIDLTAARTEAELCDLMVADAASLTPHIPQDARVVDVGTGAGAPGLALALLRPDLKVTIVEPLSKRTSFMRTVIGTLGRTDIMIVPDRVENVTGTWDVATSRATLPPAEWVPAGFKLAPVVWALLAKEEPPTVAGRIDVDFVYTWPLTHASRRAVRYVL